MSVFSAAMRKALELTRSGDMRGATRHIRDALKGRKADVDPSVMEGQFVVVPGETSPAPDVDALRLPVTQRAPGASPDADTGASKPVQPSGRFLSGTYSNAAGARSYKLWLPRGDVAGRPLIVMLHGCTQDADDFARGTRMNEHADRLGCCVLYPIQSGGANAQRCWRWFEAAHQARDAGEPSLLAGMTDHVIAEYRLDPARVYVAGLSAGGAMALVMSEAYPDLFAAVAVHSGLPVGAAHNVPSAMAAMAGRPVKASRNARARSRPVPGMVIHGQADRTVAAANADAIVDQLRARYEQASSSPLVRQTSEEPSHRATTYRTADGTLVIEHWTVHAGGHAWSGGDRNGSYTDPDGPEASEAIAEFFLSHAHDGRRAC